MLMTAAPQTITTTAVPKSMAAAVVSQPILTATVPQSMVTATAPQPIYPQPRSLADVQSLFYGIVMEFPPVPQSTDQPLTRVYIQSTIRSIVVEFLRYYLERVEEEIQIMRIKFAELKNAICVALNNAGISIYELLQTVHGLPVQLEGLQAQIEPATINQMFSLWDYIYAVSPCSSVNRSAPDSCIYPVHHSFNCCGVSSVLSGES
jgi:hypothetical protein